MSKELRPALLHNLKQAVMEACNVKDATPADVKDSEPIIGGTDKLQLDSLDALEIVMMIERNFGIRIGGDAGSRDLFRSFEKLADHILEHADKEKIETFTKVS